MTTITADQILPPEEVSKYFVLEGHRLYRRLESGACTLVKSMDGHQAVTIFKRHRLRGVDIAWCLYYGNWPHFPIVQIGEDPLDFSKGNLFAARLKTLRYRQTPRAKLFYHPLSDVGHATPERCRQHWEMLAMEWYSRDMLYVERVETFAREQRAKYLRETQPLLRSDRTHARVHKMSRPKAIPGREWHWVKDKWIDLPEPIHVADDYRMRLAATLAGCTEFRFDPTEQRVFAYLPSGERWFPAVQ